MSKISVPTGTPTVTIEVTRTIAAPIDAVWLVLCDARRVAPCLPGAELTDDFGDDRYAGRARVAVGPLGLSFSGRAQVTERDANDHRITLLADGSDIGGRTSARLTACATAEAGTTMLLAVAEVYLRGPIAQFGRALGDEISRRLFEQFALAVEHTALTGHAPAVTRGANPLVLVFGAWRTRLRATWRRD
jgi:carbon-monoxide dehydrogenase small subunit